MMSVCAYTSICEEDARWIDQYLAEAERLQLPFAIHLDRCSDGTARRLTSHPLCVEWTTQDNPNVEFNEMHKQGILDRIVNLERFDWALAWDVDETWERNAPEKLNQLSEYLSYDLLDFRWYNLWDDPRFIRVDPPFNTGHRANLLNLTDGRQWRFTHKITNGPKLHRQGKEHPGTVGPFDLVCLHHGMLTRDDRLKHKCRWDRIYSTAVGSNPYGFWNCCCDESITPVLQEHDYR